MLMLEDLKKRPSLSQEISRIINTNDYKSVMHTALENSTINDEIFTKSDLAFVGASHGKVIGPLFALSVNEQGNLATLKEYLTYSDTDKDLEQVLEDELTALAVVISVFYPEINRIKLPSNIIEFRNSECEVKHIFNGSYLYITKY